MLFNGAPTAISQRCPGCPCAGLSPAPVATGLAPAGCMGVTANGLTPDFNGAAFTGLLPKTGLEPTTWPEPDVVGDVVVVALTGLLSNGAPTAISHR